MYVVQDFIRQEFELPVMHALLATLQVDLEPQDVSLVQEIRRAIQRQDLQVLGKIEFIVP